MSRGSADTIKISEHKTAPRDVIVIGIPTFGMVSIHFTAAMLNLRMPMNMVIRHVYVKGKEVGDARNEIVAKALAIEEHDPSQKCKAVYFIDDDVLINSNSLVRLLEHRKPIVSGLYYTKAAISTPLILHGEYQGTAHNWTPGDLVECWAHGMGNTLIDADVFRRLRDDTDLGVDGYGYPQWFKTQKDELIAKPDGTPAMYNATEDVYFLRKAAALGFQPLVDTGQHCFGFHFDHKSNRGFPLTQWDQYMTTGTVTWPAPDGGSVTWGAR